MKRRKLAMYIRLSDADEEVTAGTKDESDSITNQRNLLYSYIREHKEFENFDVLEYFDDGFTGTDFGKRQEFQRMIRDAEAGAFDTILVKDLSRFGRDYLEVGNYMEFVFPAMGIRFIAVNDGYDSDKNFGMTGGMDVAFKNLIYQMYSRDLSRKVKSARQNRNRNGEYTASFVCYGYRKDSADKHKLVIEEETAEVVREIFSLAISGKNCNEIARLLNERKEPTRLQNQWKRGIHYVPVHDKGDYLWSNTAVLDILRNEQYTGVLIQNRNETVGFGEYKKLKKRDRSKWSMVPGGVPAIVSREVFEQANSNRPRTRKPKAGMKRRVNLFTCPYCGRKLDRTRSNPKKYACPKRNMVRDSECEIIFMLTETAEKMVLDAVNEEAALRIELLEKENSTIRPADDIQSQIAELSTEYERIEENGLTDYTKYRNGTYTKEEYLNIRQENKELLESIQSRIDGLKETMQAEEEQNPEEMEEAVNACRILTEYDGEVISKLVDKVYIYNDKDIEVVFK